MVSVSFLNSSSPGNLRSIWCRSVPTIAGFSRAADSIRSVGLDGHPDVRFVRKIQRIVSRDSARFSNQVVLTVAFRIFELEVGNPYSRTKALGMSSFDCDCGWADCDDELKHIFDSLVLFLLPPECEPGHGLCQHAFGLLGSHY